MYSSIKAKLLTVFTKRYFLDVCWGSEYASEKINYLISNIHLARAGTKFGNEA